jgi:hypothetical protein
VGSVRGRAGFGVAEVFVSFLWYNGTTTDFRDTNRIFYRSFARRVFLQYKNDTRPFAIMNRKYGGPDSIRDVARKLSALLFLEDITITAKRSAGCCCKGFLYANPNAEQSLLRRAYAADYFRGLRSTEIDTFEHDNY